MNTAKKRVLEMAAQELVFVGAQPVTKKQAKQAKQHQQCFTPWRHYAPGYLVTMGDGGLSESGFAMALQLLGFENLASLLKALGICRRDELPADIQKKLSRVFEYGGNGMSACKEKLNMVGFEEYGMPFPFAVAKEAPIEFEIYDFWMRLDKDGDTEIGFRAGLKVPGILKPSSKAAIRICEMIAEGEDFTDPDKEGRGAIASWLESFKVPKRMANNDEYLYRMNDQLRDRIEDLIWLRGADLLGGPHEVVVGDGEEEKGYALVNEVVPDSP